MDSNITDKEYPVSNVWFFKHAFPVIIGFVVFLVYSSASGLSTNEKTDSVFVMFIFVFLGIAGMQFLYNYFRVKYFHFLIADHYIVFNQGVFKKENRNTPYGRLQGVYLNQGIFERIFGLASLTIEDFSVGGFSKMDVRGYIGRGKGRYEAVGFEGCRIHIPGLMKDDAEKLKEIILMKIKENPIEDGRSGL